MVFGLFVLTKKIYLVKDYCKRKIFFLPGFFGVRGLSLLYRIHRFQDERVSRARRMIRSPALPDP